jgi:hypothetical protein
MNTKLVAATVLTLLLCGAADAAQAHGVNARQALQHERIEHGVAQGDLTRREALGLQRQQRHIARSEARMRRDDGVLGPVERARLDVRQDRASAAIRRQRIDAQRR